MEKFVLSKVTGILSISEKHHCLWVANCFGNSILQISVCLCQSGSVHIIFSYQYRMSISGKVFLLWDEFFQCLEIVAFQLQLV